jgi:hypothetical protein
VVEEREDDFAAAVLAVLKSRVRAQIMGEKARRWAAQWSSLNLAVRMAELYREVQPAACYAGVAVG